MSDTYGYEGAMCDILALQNDGGGFPVENEGSLPAARLRRYIKKLVAIEEAAKADRATWSCQSKFRDRDTCAICKNAPLCAALDKEATR